MARRRGAFSIISALRSLIFCTTTPECSSVDVDHDLLDRLLPLA